MLRSVMWLPKTHLQMCRSEVRFLRDLTRCRICPSQRWRFSLSESKFSHHSCLKNLTHGLTHVKALCASTHRVVLGSRNTDTPDGAELSCILALTGWHAVLTAAASVALKGSMSVSIKKREMWKVLRHHCSPPVRYSEMNPHMKPPRSTISSLQCFHWEPCNLFQNWKKQRKVKDDPT